MEHYFDVWCVIYSFVIILRYVWNVTKNEKVPGYKSVFYPEN